LKKELKTDQQVFQKVYNFSFDFAKQQGQKSMRTLFCFVFSLSLLKNLNQLLSTDSMSPFSFFLFLK